MTGGARPHGSDIERVFREAYGDAVATLIRRLGDITLAEEAVQEAFAVAVDRWRRDGVPANPVGWIVTTARNRAIDDIRRAARGRELRSSVAILQQEPDHSPEGEDTTVRDDRLRLIFTCCHPALGSEHQVALTLRLLGGLGVDEIARAFVVSEAAMAKRLVRAKHKIRAAGIPYRVPDADELSARLGSVLAVLSLVYTTGHDDPARAPLRREAIRLARSLVDAMPEEPEAAGLLALLLLNDARAASHVANGELVQLRDQDRAAWDRAMIDEGLAIVRWCVARRRPGPYQLQAAIQAVHCSAPTFDATDWRQITVLYDHLARLLPTPIVELNRAIAEAEVSGPAAALAALEPLTPELEDHYLWHATRGTMLRRLGRHGDGRTAFARAVELAPTDAARRSLERELDRAIG